MKSDRDVVFLPVVVVLVSMALAVALVFALCWAVWSGL